MTIATLSIAYADADGKPRRDTVNIEVPEGANASHRRALARDWGEAVRTALESVLGVAVAPNPTPPANVITLSAACEACGTTVRVGRACGMCGTASDVGGTP